jgi:hypothetical protein
MLVPRYLAEVPSDPLTGLPPVYARNGSGFTLHFEVNNTERARDFDWHVPK